MLAVSLAISGAYHAGMRLLKLLTLPLILASVVESASASHPISLTETQIYVARTNARVRVKLFAEDLFLFHDLQPNDIDVLPPDQLRSGLELHRQFLLDKITLRDAKGIAFKGNVTDVQPFEIPEEGISVEELMLHSATYELEYPFAEPPEFLTLQQDISDANFIFPSEMKLTLHQAGTDMTYTDVLKPGAAQTIRFDWSSEPLAEDASEEDWKAWFEKQREETLGITSYSSVYSFIYIEPAEVRHEILIPLANLKTILPLEHQDPAFIDINEQDGVRELIRNWLSEKNPTTVNSVAVQPEFSRIDFYGLDLKDFARKAEERRVSLANGRVGIILTYRPADYPVREATLTWERFYSSLRKVQSVVFSYPDALSRFEFSKFNVEEDNVFRWTATESLVPLAGETQSAELPPPVTMSLPIASISLLALAGGCLFFANQHSRRMFLALTVLAVVTFPFARVEIEHPFSRPVPVTAAEANRVFHELHSGAYRALDFGTEQRIYEELEKSIDGDLLESVYLQLREGLELKEQGGAVARVRSLDYLAGAQNIVDDVGTQWPAFRFRSRWTVSGTVEHWGHVHERQNQFCAVFNVEPRSGLWKITDMKIEEQESKVTSARLRKF